MEEPIAKSPPEPQQTSGQTTVPEQVVEGLTEPSMSALSTRPAEGNTSASRVMEQTEEQQPEVRAQPIFTDAETCGKALVITEATDAGPAPRPKEEPKEDEVEEVLGHPQDK